MLSRECRLPNPANRRNGITTGIYVPCPSSPSKQHPHSPNVRSLETSSAIYNRAKAARATAPRLKIDWLLRVDAMLAVAWAGALSAVPLPAPSAPPAAAPLPADGEGGVLPVEPLDDEPEPEPEPEPDAEPGVIFSGAVAARAVKEATVLLPDSGALMAPTMPAWQCCP